MRCDEKQLPSKNCGERAFLLSLFERVSYPRRLIYVKNEMPEPPAAGSIIIVKNGVDEPRTIIRPVVIEKDEDRFGSLMS
jgi:hypothetical protein